MSGFDMSRGGEDRELVLRELEDAADPTQRTHGIRATIEWLEAALLG